MIFLSANWKWAQKYRSKAAHVSGCTLRSSHIHKLLKIGAQNQEAHAPDFIGTHIQLAAHDLTNNHT